MGDGIHMTSSYLPDIFTFFERHFGLVVELADLDGEEMEITIAPLSEDSI
jgi:hypothetical protein